VNGWMGERIDGCVNGWIGRWVGKRMWDEVTSPLLSSAK
jgi:hypothetical protein